jgi:alkylation response protein AidB-like acyl-CoA dehydrogenase
MNFEPTEEQKLLRATAAAFVRKHCPPLDVRRWDKSGESPKQVYAALAGAGFLSMVVPAAYGRLGSSISDCAAVLEKLARSSVDFATRLVLISWGTMILARKPR